MNIAKPVRFSNHALGYLSQRGFTCEEVEEAIRTTPWGQAELGRLECRKNFQYQWLWNGRMYGTKQVRPIFVNQGDHIFVITVYTYFF